ncbi:expressed unknown protein [Seminavis robusta]|uniref:GAT domain-containing protein n=1 Tax=Seminavis robusta TaxID=568900 RepID=A0A9N8DU65_9STRA|nr:expressed unknown protein [Seminavis robusta]|eukprot:Sro251_g099360.1 n/a (219) ;mRNA; f:66773-67429
MTAPVDAQEQARIDNKITADLNVVIDKMDLLDSMLKPGADSPTPSVKKHEALLAVIGFLEACAPRMVELVEAAAQGLLSGHVLEKCLAVNDRLLKQLQEIDTLALTETAASTTAASVPVKDMAELLLDDDDDEDDDKRKQAPPAGTKSTGEDEEDNGKLPAAEDGKVPAADEDGKMPAEDDGKMPAAAAPDVAATGEKDSFDDFFAERTAAFTSNNQE